MAPETPLIKKLGIKPGQKLLIMNSPEGYLPKLVPLPEGTGVETGGHGPFDFVQVFVSGKGDVEAYASKAIQALKPGGLLWFSYPKKSSAIKTDISRDIGWEPVYTAGFRPVTQVAIDTTWSALRFRPRTEVKSRAVHDT